MNNKPNRQDRLSHEQSWKCITVSFDLITYFKVLERWLDLFFVFSKKQKYETDYA